MKKMMLTLAILPSLALAAAAQDVPWKDLAPGDPLQVTLLNGATISGTLVVPRSKTPSVDFGTESSLTLDVSLEAPGLIGTMTFEKRDLRRIRRLRIKVGPPCNLGEGLRSAPTKAGSAPAAPIVVVPTQEPPAPTQADKDSDDLKKAIDFYTKFPPPDWGPVRHTLNIQKQARGQALTPLEREFESGYPDLWEKGRDASKK
jgi:hypothetical protein